MSRMATSEYIGARRRAYASAKPGKRKIILDEVCDTTGYSRKYANRLLTGSRKFKERKGRGPTYTERDKAALERIWREAGCPCTTYLRADIEEWLGEYRACVAHIPDDVAAHLLAMSASTMEDAVLEVAPVPEERQRARRAEERLRRAHPARRKPPGQTGTGSGAAAPVRRLFGLQELLRPLQDARGENQARGRQGLRMPVRQAADAIRQGSLGPGPARRDQGRTPPTQGEDQRHRAVPPHPEKAAPHQTDAGAAEGIFPRPRQPGLGAWRRHPFGAGLRFRGRGCAAARTAISPLQESVQYLTNAMNTSTIKKCPFYLTNWDRRYRSILWKSPCVHW